MKKGSKDAYYRQAKQDKYMARSVYKLIELDKKYQLFKAAKPGVLVEFGISPGSWAQYYTGLLHPETTVVGIDLKPCKVALPRGKILTVDLGTLTPEALQAHLPAPPFGVLSDALPNMTGNKIQDQVRMETLRDHMTMLAFAVLKMGGWFLIKTFDCPSHMDWVKRCRQRFMKTALEKPQASRKVSPEVYFVGLGFKGGQ